MFKPWGAQKLSDEEDDSSPLGSAQLKKKSPKVSSATPRSPTGVSSWTSAGAWKESSIQKVSSVTHAFGGWQNKYAQHEEPLEVDAASNRVASESSGGRKKAARTPRDNPATPRDDHFTDNVDLIKAQLEEELSLERRPQKKNAAAGGAWPPKVKGRGRSSDSEEAAFASDPWSAGAQQREQSEKRKQRVASSGSQEALGLAAAGRSTFGAAASAWPPMPNGAAAPDQRPSTNGFSVFPGFSEQSSQAKPAQGWPAPMQVAPSEQLRPSAVAPAEAPAAMPAWPAQKVETTDSTAAALGSSAASHTAPSAWPMTGADLPERTVAPSAWPAPAATLGAASSTASAWPSQSPTSAWGSAGASSQQTSQGFSSSPVGTPNGGSPDRDLRVKAEEEVGVTIEQSSPVPVASEPAALPQPVEPEIAPAMTSSDTSAADVVPAPGQFDEAILAALAALPRDSLVSVLSRLAAKRPAEVALAFNGSGRIAPTR